MPFCARRCGHQRTRWRSLSIMRAVLAIGLAGCATSPQFEGTTAPKLVDSPAPRAASEVRIEVRSTEWYDTDRSGDAFMLAFPASSDPATIGRSLGGVRSDDLPLDSSDPMRCAWQVVPMGDPRPCNVPRAQAMAEVQPVIHRAFDELRERAGRAGATVVANVACFTTFDPAHVWCEGTALVPDPTRPDRVEVDPSTPTAADLPIAKSPLVLTADADAMLFGKTFSQVAAIGLRYRPVELAFDVGQLHNDLPNQTVYFGLTAQLHIPLRSGFDLIAGGAANVVVPNNNSVNPIFRGLFEAFTGVAYQAETRIAGKAQPYIQLRAGVAHSHDREISSPTEPLVGLVVGLSSIDR
jgi:hypothetical protein